MRQKAAAGARPDPRSGKVPQKGKCALILERVVKKRQYRLYLHIAL